MEIIPSILAKTSKEFQNKLTILNNHTEETQIDIMDGKFVPEKTFQDPIKAAKHNLKYELHLMVEDPEASIEEWKNIANVRRVIIHAEIKKPLKPIIEKIKSLGWKVGVALNPETPHASIDECVTMLDTVLVMTVHPGASGQDFADAVVPNHLLAKITELHKEHLGLQISVDGGINEQTILYLLKAGATRFVVGSAIWHSGDPIQNYKNLLTLIS